MNFVEVMELFRALSKFCPQTSLISPKMVCYNAEHEGYMIMVNEGLVKPNYHRFLTEIVETRHLRMRKDEGYLVIHSS
jgi:hypothetical protein